MNIQELGLNSCKLHKHIKPTAEELLKDYYTITNIDGDIFSYSMLCIECNPCRHDIFVNDTPLCCDSQTIYYFLMKNKFTVPKHITKYVEERKKRIFIYGFQELAAIKQSIFK